MSTRATQSSLPFMELPQEVEEDPQWVNFFWQGASQKIPREFKPLLLYPFLNWEKVRQLYPLWISLSEEPRWQDVDSFCRARVKQIDAPSVLQDNLDLFELTLRQVVEENPFPQKALSVLERVSRQFEEKLSLAGEEGEKLHHSLKAFVACSKEEEYFLPFSPFAPFFLLQLGALWHSSLRKKVKKKGEKLLAKLEELLFPKKEKLTPSESSFLDPKSWEKLPLARAQKQLSFSKVEELYQTLKEGVERLDREELLFWVVARTELLQSLEKKLNWAKKQRVFFVKPSQLVSQVSSLLEGIRKKYNPFFAALRRAELEVEFSYQKEVHEPYFAAFDESFWSEEERSAVPLVVLLVDRQSFSEFKLEQLVEFFSQGFPLCVLLVKVAGEKDSFHPLGLAASLPFLYLGRTSLARPSHLAQVILEGTTRHPSLVEVTLPVERTTVPPFLWLGAALEGREFPLFRYDPLEERWGGRFDLEGNPQPERDWPVYPIEVEVGGEKQKWTLGFTFADFALLLPEYERDFFPLLGNPCCEKLVKLEDYLEKTPLERVGKIPYLYGVTEEGRVQKILVSHRLVEETLLRRERWRALQELGGMRSYHGEIKAKEVEAKWEQKLQEAEQNWKKEMEEKLASLEQEVVSQAMEKLARNLLGLEVLPSQGESSPSRGESFPSSSREVKERTQEKKEGEEPKVEEHEEEREEEVVEPWIDSFLCTSCNECINLNPRMFRYNSEKQAYLADPRAGTYAELVMAAERCPARCIHPGLPLNPDEPDLEKWIERAKPFL